MTSLKNPHFERLVTSTTKQAQSEGNFNFKLQVLSSPPGCPMFTFLKTQGTVSHTWGLVPAQWLICRERHQHIKIQRRCTVLLVGMTDGVDPLIGLMRSNTEKQYHATLPQPPINMGAARRSKYHSGFGSSTVAPVVSSYSRCAKYDVVERCTVTVTPGCLDLKPQASLGGLNRIEVRPYAISVADRADRSRI